MAKHCQPFEHPADVGLAARADTLAELYEALAEGLADLICPRRTVRAAQSRRIEVRAEDLGALAVDFLCAVLSAIQENRFLVASVEAQVPAPGEAPEQPEYPVRIRAILRGETYDPARHEIHIEVKAVTYHQLEVVQSKGTWRGRVILDL